MAHSEARAWWADVQHLRDGYERTDEARRRADEADLAARRAIRERRGVEAEVSSMLSAPRRPSTAAAAIAPRRVSGPDSAQRRASGSDPGRHVPSDTDRAQPHAGDGELGAHPALEPSRTPRRGEHADARQDVATEHPRGPRVKGSATPGRRIIEIRGRTVPAPMVPRPIDTERRRPPRRALERVGGRPDRVAMWALLMGLLLILVAIGTADTPAFVALTLR
jgi:hypothetical protein